MNKEEFGELVSLIRCVTEESKAIDGHNDIQSYQDCKRWLNIYANKIEKEYVKI
jgi:hypothetical protein